jgi:hypothetical protein
MDRQLFGIIAVVFNPLSQSISRELSGAQSISSRLASYCGQFLIEGPADNPNYSAVERATNESNPTLLPVYCRHASPSGSAACTNCGESEGLEHWQFNPSGKIIPIGPFIGQIIRLPFDHFRDFVKFGGVPMLLILFAQFAFGFVAGATGKQWFSLLWFVPYLVVNAPFAVAWTKLAANGAEAVSSRNAFTFGRVESLYLFASMLLTFVLFGPSLVCIYGTIFFGWSTSFMVVGFILLAVAIPIGLRFSLALPSVALEGRMALGPSWQRTRDSMWRIFGLGFLAGLPFSIAQRFLVALEKQMPDPISLTVLGFAEVFVSFLLAASTVGAMAFAYRFLSATHAVEQNAAPT